MLIGIGAYPHLLNGQSARATDTFGLGQLTSPPVSARALADWFIAHFDCPDRPLGSLRLLLSEKVPTRYVHPQSGVAYTVPAADLGNTREAMKAWSEGEVSSDDQLILYVCGHGLAGGQNEIYPLRDFGLDDPADDGPLARSLNLNKLAGGLATARASNQLLIFDTCREKDELVEANQDGGSGFVVARPGRRLTISQKMAQCVIHSTELDNKAGGPSGAPSICAQALMRVFAGAGASQSGGAWYLKSTVICNAMSELQERLVPSGYTSQQGDQSRFANIAVRRFVTSPMVPVFIRRQNGAEFAGRTVDYCPLDGGTTVSELAHGKQWEGAVPVGTHRFRVSSTEQPTPDLVVNAAVGPVFVDLEAQ